MRKSRLRINRDDLAKRVGRIDVVLLQAKTLRELCQNNRASPIPRFDSTRLDQRFDRLRELSLFKKLQTVLILLTPSGLNSNDIRSLDRLFPPANFDRQRIALPINDRSFARRFRSPR